MSETIEDFIQYADEADYDSTYTALATYANTDLVFSQPGMTPTSDGTPGAQVYQESTYTGGISSGNFRYVTVNLQDFELGPLNGFQYDSYVATVWLKTTGTQALGFRVIARVDQVTNPGEIIYFKLFYATSVTSAGRWTASLDTELGDLPFDTTFISARKSDDGNTLEFWASPDGEDWTLELSVSNATIISRLNISTYPVASWDSGVSIAVGGQVQTAAVTNYYVAWSTGPDAPGAPEPLGINAPPPAAAYVLGTNRDSNGWAFRRLRPGAPEAPVYPSVSGSIEFQADRDVPKVISGMEFLPEETEKLNFGRDKLAVYFRKYECGENVLYPMGVFSFTEITTAKGVIREDCTGAAQDLTIVSLGDRFAELQRSDGTPTTLYAGTNPTEVMERLLEEAEIPYSIAGSVDTSRDVTTWEGDTYVANKIHDLAQLAGHRHPWADNNGIVRSVIATIVDSDIIDLERLGIVAESVTVTDNYLSAPNRIIVVDNTFGQYPLRGIWDAPAYLPHSKDNIGYYRTQIVEVPGIGSLAQAEAVAASVGESATARSLDCEILPTHLLDGPVIIRYLNTLWKIESWDMPLEEGSTMRMSATELVNETRYEAGE